MDLRKLSRRSHVVVAIVAGTSILLQSFQTLTPMKIQSLISSKLSLALFAGAAAVFAAASAQAAVVTVTPATPINIGNSIDGIYFNVVTGASGTSGAAVPGWDINPYNNGGGLTFYGAASPSGILVASIAVPATTSIALVLSPGDMVSPAGIYNQFQTTAPDFQSEGDRYVGFRFRNEGTGAMNYAYMMIRSGADVGFPASIVSYGYDNSGIAVMVPVPEPATYALFGMGLAAVAGLSAFRRRRAG